MTDRVIPVRDHREGRKETSANIEQAKKSNYKHAREMHSEEIPSTELYSQPGVSSISDLNDLLYIAKVESVFEAMQMEFIPKDICESILKDVSTDQMLQLLLDEPNKASEDDKALANYILQHAKTLFLILVFIRHGSIYAAMKMFKDHQFGDKCLPFEGTTIKQLGNNHISHPFGQMQGCREGRIWRVGTITAFETEQWKFYAATISTATSSENFGQQPIPFLDRDRLDSGAHGIVNKYTIHHAHFEDPKRLLHGKTPTPVVAVKAFRRSGERVTLDWEKEVTALAKMNELEQGHIVRFITAFQRGKPHDLEHYVVFEWADGGNLGNLWKEHSQPKRSDSVMKWVINQLHGLAKALRAAHNLGDGRSYRHGDLKPANILWFRGGDGYGTLKIGDWGEAKSHEKVTSLRHNTTTKTGTRRYEPPEISVQMLQPEENRPGRSRLYDIWGFGCVTLEFIIWYLYGQAGLTRFNDSHYGEYSMFYERVPPTRDTFDVHHVVRHWMDHMARDIICRPGETALGERDILCRPGETALGDLLQVVRTGLLIIDLPPGGGGDPKMNAQQPSNAPELIPSIRVDDNVPSPAAEFNPFQHKERLRSDQLEESLRKIVEDEGREHYWHQVPGVPKPPPQYIDRNYLLPHYSGRRLSPESVNLQTATPTKSDYGQVTVMDPVNWEFKLDNDFAARIFSLLGDSTAIPSHRSPPLLSICTKCRNFNERLPFATFKMSYETQKLEQNANDETCDLCSLLWHTYQRNSDKKYKTVRFQKDNSTLKMSGAKHPVLALYRDDNIRCRAPAIQIGFAELPGVGTNLYFGLIRGWLDYCDGTHREPVCKPSRLSPTTTDVGIKLPTRLIDVGNDGDKTVRLQETIRLQEMRVVDPVDWIALSHCWGPSPHFCTTHQNIKSHITGMQVATLPLTFQDAIKVTRALKKHYLWIDSICIIQGEDGDFFQEFKRMEDVYSGAYCVLAASCATGQRSGFLQPRDKREFVALSSKEGDRDGGTIYVSSLIENFRDHVLRGALNKRGWVLQEHALARRTIFFTKHQTYWECGHGVRCETMARMTNRSAALLGDSDFPKILDRVKHGERILYYQELFRQYSRLDLSLDYDRPVAIEGLQQRLSRTMGVCGRFGVFYDRKNTGLLRRSLLWHRGEDTDSLKRITFPNSWGRVPSWSWMSVSGGIDYFHLTWSGYDWQAIQSSWPYSTDAALSNAFAGKVQAIDCSAAGETEHKIVFDNPADSELSGPMAMVLGIEKVPTDIGNKIHYILVVKAITTMEPDEDMLYERIGAGYIPGKCLKGEPRRCSLV